MNAITDAANAALRTRPGQPVAPPAVSAPSVTPVPGAVDSTAPAGVVIPPVATPDDPDAAPASAPLTLKAPPSPEESTKSTAKPVENVSKAESDADSSLENGEHA